MIVQGSEVGGGGVGGGGFGPGGGGGDGASVLVDSNSSDSVGGIDAVATNTKLHTNATTVTWLLISMILYCEYLKFPRGK